MQASSSPSASTSVRPVFWHNIALALVATRYRLIDRGERQPEDPAQGARPQDRDRASRQRSAS